MPPVPPGYFLAAKKRMRRGMLPRVVQAREQFNSPDPTAPMVQRGPGAPMGPRQPGLASAVPGALPVDRGPLRGAQQPVAPRPDQVRGAWAQQPPPQPRSTAPDWGNVRYNNVAGNPRQGMDYREKMLPDGNVLHDYPGTANDVVVRPHTRRLPVTGGVQAPNYRANDPVHPAGGYPSKQQIELLYALAQLKRASLLKSGKRLHRQ